MVRHGFMTSVVIGLMWGTIGCQSQSDYKTIPAVKQASPLGGHDHDHGHSVKGPHGGGIVELGEEEYHAEIVVDHDSESIIAYLLGKDAKSAEPVGASEISIERNGKTTLTLKAAPQTGDAEGKASKFQLVDHDLVHELMDAGFLHAKFKIKIDEKEYLADVDYHMDGSSHDDHDDHKPTEGK